MFATVPNGNENIRHNVINKKKINYSIISRIIMQIKFRLMDSCRNRSLNYYFKREPVNFPRNTNCLPPFGYRRRDYFYHRRSAAIEIMNVLLSSRQ